MTNRRKSKHPRTIGSSQRLKEDRISQLPDSLKCQILSHLPSKEMVKTSVLSSRWRSLWLWVPRLELSWCHFFNFIAFRSFGNMFFDSNRVSNIHKLKLRLDANGEYYLTSWIDSVVKRKIQRLHVRQDRGIHFCEMPLSLYDCETLVSLKLHKLTLVNPEFVSLPCLKILHLKDIVYSTEATFERLVSSCPILEDLKIDVIWKDGRIYRVHSQSLKRLRLIRCSSSRFYSVPGVMIDAPLLCCLEIDDTSSQSFIVKNLESSAKLDIHMEFGLVDFDEATVSSRRSRVRNFLSGISKVMDMKISKETFKVIHHYSKFEQLPQFDYMSRLDVTLNVSDLKGLLTFFKGCPNLKYLILNLSNDFGHMRSEEMNDISFLPRLSRVMDMKISADTFKLIYQYSKLEPLPQFCYLSRLCLSLHVSILKWLPTFLESCPNLKSLNLDLDNDFEKTSSEEMNQISFSTVPECLLSTLEFVDYRIPFSGNAAEMKVVKYFLENSAILKKLSLRFYYYCPRKDDIFKELLKISRRSSTCQVVVG